MSGQITVELIDEPDDTLAEIELSTGRLVRRLDLACTAAITYDPPASIRGVGFGVGFQDSIAHSLGDTLRHHGRMA